MYCTECGTPIEYTSSKPKFCSNCGFDFVTKTKASLSPPAKPLSTSIENSEDLELDEYDVREIDPRIYDMRGLDVEISENSERKNLTFGELFPGDDRAKQKKKK